MLRIILKFLDVLSEFSNCINSPNGRPCVVLADAESDLDFINMNKAFRVLHSSSNPLLITLGNGKFYHRADQGPCLDTGAYASALKFAVEDAGRCCEHLVIGKPEETYFMSAVDDLGLTKEQVIWKETKLGLFTNTSILELYLLSYIIQCDHYFWFV